MVISTDCSLGEKLDSKVMFVYANKCKSPDSYSASAYYESTLHYIPQRLCEMNS